MPSEEEKYHRAFASWDADMRRTFMADAKLCVALATEKDPADPVTLRFIESYLRWLHKVIFTAVSRGDFDAEITDEEKRLLIVVSAYLGKVDGQGVDDFPIPNKPGMAAANAFGTLVTSESYCEDPTGAGEKWLYRLRKRGVSTDFAADLLSLLPAKPGRPKA